MNIVNKLKALLAVAVVAGAVATVPVVQVGAIDGMLKAAENAKSAEQKSNLEGSGGIFQTITRILIYLVGAISVIMLVFGGVRYTVSGGDQKAVESAKNTIMYAIIGIVVSLLAFAVVEFVIKQMTAS